MPAFVWALVLLVASAIITAVITPKQQELKPTNEADIDFPQEQEGTAQSVLFGDGWTKGFQTLWHGNFRTIKIKKGGKK